MEATSALSAIQLLGLSGTPKSIQFRACFRPTKPSNEALIRKITRRKTLDGNINQSPHVDFDSQIQVLSREKLHCVAQELLKSGGFQTNDSTLTALLLYCVDNGFLLEAKAIWDTILQLSFVPSVEMISELMNAYGRMRYFDEVREIVHQISLRGFNFLPQIYKVAIYCFGMGGQLEMMEDTLREMVSKGFLVDSATWNAYIIYYSSFASLKEMEAAYYCLKKSRILIEDEAIRAMSFSYIKAQTFYNLGEFLKVVGLVRRNVGNLLWNFLLLSYAANFKMKSLQREFLRMVEAGFYPDLTTFNIRSLAFSKMSLFWDLHLSLDHMKHERVVPDLVTYGCIVDAYLDKRLGRNLDFALSKMNLNDSPEVSTDPFVFEVMGKGDFHSSSELFLEFRKWNNWTYKDLIAIYLRKKYRSNQIFWNY